MTRTYWPDSMDERAVQLQMLAYARETALAKVEGLSNELAHRPALHTSPLTTPGSIMNHLRWTEHDWIEVHFAGRPQRAPWTAQDPDRELRLGTQLPLNEVIAGYREQIRIDDDIIAAADFDDLAALPDMHAHQNLRWTIAHLIEETSRHNGHLDLLREMADGSTGR